MLVLFFPCCQLCFWFARKSGASNLARLGGGVYEGKAEMKRPVLLVEALAAHNDSGLGRHVRLFAESLASLTPHFDVHVLWPSHARFPFPQGVQIHIADPRWPLLWREVLLPFLARQVKAQMVVHLGYTLSQFFTARPSMLLVPDAGPLEEGNLRMSMHESRNRRMLRKQIPSASLCVVSSHFTQERLVDLFGLPNSRICVLPPFGAYVEEWQRETPFDEVLRSRFPEGYFLALGNIEPRKNHLGLARAYAWLRNVIREEGGDPDGIPPLLIIGHKAWGYGALVDEISRLTCGDSIHILGHVDDESLGAYLRQATVFVSASLYEGFGMPLFEAMCLGKACIFHRDTCQAEYAADAAMQVNAQNPQALGEALLVLWRNADLRMRFGELARARTQCLLQTDIATTLQLALQGLLDPLNGKGV